jgi:hypothetical protein
MKTPDKIQIVYAPPSAYYGGVGEETRKKKEKLLGEMEITPTSRDEIYLNAHSGHANTDTGLWLHGFKYGVSAHAYRHSDGLWRLYPQGTKQPEIDRIPYACKPLSTQAPKSIKKKFRQAITFAVNDWADENERALEEAEKEYLQYAYDVREQELEAVEARAYVLREEMRLIEAGQHLPTYPEGERYRG